MTFPASAGPQWQHEPKASENRSRTKFENGSPKINFEEYTRCLISKLSYSCCPRGVIEVSKSITVPWAELAFFDSARKKNVTLFRCGKNVLLI